ncbi:alpha/beta hydrolase fold domain-containing protein [Sinorhizobium meliloti]|nr:alpha/beta hydrolase fold domain-containing protein [Sinorhizobium meliloti]
MRAYGAVRRAGRSILRRGRGLILRHLRHGRHSESQELFSRSANHAWSVRPSKSHATDLGNGRRAAPIPSLSPLFCDLAGLPAALFIVGELDPVLDDSLLMYDKWQNANHNATLLIVPEGPHGMNRLPTRMASKINDFARQWIKKAIEEARARDNVPR